MKTNSIYDYSATLLAEQYSRIANCSAEDAFSHFQKAGHDGLPALAVSVRRSFGPRLKDALLHAVVQDTQYRAADPASSVPNAEEAAVWDALLYTLMPELYTPYPCISQSDDGI